jgi:hypothetical protein
MTDQLRVLFTFGLVLCYLDVVRRYRAAVPSARR